MKIKDNDTFTLDKFIEESLYNKTSGYYMKKNPFGKKGDFITAPNISVLFSEMIAIWVVSFWQNLGCPEEFNLIELGAGNGEMMKVLVNTFDKFPIFKNSCRIKILERSKILKKKQKANINKKNIQWLNNLSELDNLPCIFLANEFFDALPIKQFIKKEKNGLKGMSNSSIKNLNISMFLLIWKNLKIKSNLRLRNSRTLLSIHQNQLNT